MPLFVFEFIHFFLVRTLFLSWCNVEYITSTQQRTQGVSPASQRDCWVNTAVVPPIIWQSGQGLLYLFSEISLNRNWLHAMRSTCIVSLLKFWMHQTFNTSAGEFSSSCTLNPTNPALQCMASRRGSPRGSIFTWRSVVCVGLTGCKAIFLHIEQSGQIYRRTFCDPFQNPGSRLAESGSRPAAGR